jgi:hypothetical protein
MVECGLAARLTDSFEIAGTETPETLTFFRRGCQRRCVSGLRDLAPGARSERTLVRVAFWDRFPGCRLVTPTCALKADGQCCKQQEHRSTSAHSRTPMGRPTRKETSARQQAQLLHFIDSKRNEFTDRESGLPIRPTHQRTAPDDAHRARRMPRIAKAPVPRSARHSVRFEARAASLTCARPFANVRAHLSRHPSFR